MHMYTHKRKHKHKHTRIHTRIHTHIHAFLSLSLFLTHTHTPSLFPKHTLSLSHTHTHTHICSFLGQDWLLILFKYENATVHFCQNVLVLFLVFPVLNYLLIFYESTIPIFLSLVELDFSIIRDHG